MGKFCTRSFELFLALFSLLHPILFISVLFLLRGMFTRIFGVLASTTDCSARLPPKSGLDNALYEYELFAVINHEGQIDNGHYTNYARFKDEWFRFDDDKVTHSNLSACLQSSAYMLFYVKRHLDYKPNMVPSYIRVRENEAVREKEREQEKEREKEREKEKEKERERERQRERERERVERERELEDALLATV